jgi:hypothetical protein
MREAAHQPEQCAQTLPGAVVAHQPNAKVTWRGADRAPSTARIADESDTSAQPTEAVAQNGGKKISGLFGGF